MLRTFGPESIAQARALPDQVNHQPLFCRLNNALRGMPQEKQDEIWAVVEQLLAEVQILAHELVST